MNQIMEEEVLDHATVKPVRQAQGLHRANRGGKPWLVSLLLRRPRLYRHFLHFYRRLQQLPRWARERLAQRFALGLAGAALMLALSRAPVSASVITVDDDAVDIVADSECSLIEAIINANNGVQTYASCEAGSAGADTIVLPSGKTFILTNSFANLYVNPTGLPLITSEITIEGNGSTIWRDPADPDQFRLLTIVAGGTLTLNQVTLSGGHALNGNGGAIYIDRGNLTLNDSTITGNTADLSGGGLHSEYGTIEITRSTFAANTAKRWGGAVHNHYGSVEISSSTLHNNQAGSVGGAIESYAGTLVITGSTISGNNSLSGGGILNAGYNDLTISNSTLSGNVATNTGGGLSNYGYATITNTTFTDNTAKQGGGIYNPKTEGDTQSELTLQRTLIAGNHAPNAPSGREVFNNGGTVTADNHNLFGYNGDPGIVGFTPGATDIKPGVPLGDILETTLDDNSGPMTGASPGATIQTHALPRNSPAVNVAPGTDCDNPPDNVDQRGRTRGTPSTQACDVGAFELHTCTHFVSKTGKDTNNGMENTPWLTIQRAATATATELPPDSTVCVHVGTYIEKVTFTRSGELGKPITFQSYPGETAVVDGSGPTLPLNEDALFLITTQSFLIIKDFTLTNYRTSEMGRDPTGILIEGTAHHIELRNNVIHNIKNTFPPDSMLRGTNAHGINIRGTSPSLSAPVHDIIVDGNTLHDLVLGSSESLTINGNIQNWQVTNNKIYDTNNIGIDAAGFHIDSLPDNVDQAHDGLIAGNHIYDVNASDNPSYESGGASAACIYVDGGTRIVVERNRLHQCNVGVSISSERPGGFASYVTMRNNLIYNNTDAGLVMGPSSADKGSAMHNVVVNNTFYQNRQDADGFGAELYFQFNTSDNLIMNNIFYANDKRWFIKTESPLTNTGTTVNHNLFFWFDGKTNGRWRWPPHPQGEDHHKEFAAYQNASNNDLNSRNGQNPLFLNANLTATANFSLQLVSPAIGIAGMTLGSQNLAQSGSLDFNGQLRIQNNYIEIGAHEFTSGSMPLLVTGQANNPSGSAALSADGLIVAFQSTADNLVAADANGNIPDIFVFDRVTAQTTLIPVGDGSTANGPSANPALSADGRIVAFQSLSGSLARANATPQSDIFVHDRQSGTTTRVSVAPDGSPANAGSANAALSAAGRLVAFDSAASNLVSQDTNNRRDIFLHDRETGQTTLISVAANGAQGNGDSENPALSADGRFVAFVSMANNLVNGDTNGTRDIFVYDRETGQITRVSVASDGTQADSLSEGPAISADGHTVVFESLAGNLGSDDPNNPDVFLHDRNTGQTIHIASSGGPANLLRAAPSLSADGRLITFASAAADLVSGDTNGKRDIFVYDRMTGAIRLVSAAPDSTPANGDSTLPAISANGLYIVFESQASNLVNRDTNDVPDIFIQEQPVISNTATFVSTITSGSVAGIDFSPADVLLFDGSNWSLFFDGSAHGLVDGRHNINAVYIPDPAGDELYLSFAQKKVDNFPALGQVYGHDILHFNGSDFAWYFDGSDVGLTVGGEKLDGLHILDGSLSPIGQNCQAYLLISTVGSGRVRSHDGRSLPLHGEDILGFCLTSAGSTTRGLWHMALDGSAEGMPKNSTDSISASKDGQTIYLTTKGAFNVDTAAGTHSMVYQFDRMTGTFSGPHFVAADVGLTQQVDALHVAGELP